MSAFETVLQRARKHRRTGAHSALISCPAAGHEDRHPSVTVSETADGAVLMYCRSRQCDFASMVAGLGMELQHFFPPRPDFTGDHRPPLKRITPAGDILSALSDEIQLCYLVLNDFHEWVLSKGERGQWPNGTETERLSLALQRIKAGAEEATGSALKLEEERAAILKAAQLTPQEESDIDNLRDHGVVLGKQEEKETINARP